MHQETVSHGKEEHDTSDSRLMSLLGILVSQCRPVNYCIFTFHVYDSDSFCQLHLNKSGKNLNSLFFSFGYGFHFSVYISIAFILALKFLALTVSAFNICLPIVETISPLNSATFIQEMPQQNNLWSLVSSCDLLPQQHTAGTTCSIPTSSHWLVVSLAISLLPCPRQTGFWVTEPCLDRTWSSSWGSEKMGLQFCLCQLLDVRSGGKSINTLCPHL